MHKMKLSKVYAYTGKVVEFVVQKEGIYQLECWGAAGGGTNKPKGAYSLSYVSLKRGEKLYILVGEEAGTGASSSTDIRCGGGGGGTFIAKGLSLKSSIPLCVAGGGGSQNAIDTISNYAHGQATQEGGDLENRKQKIGYGGICSQSGSGGGFYGNGCNGTELGFGYAGIAFINGGTRVLSPNYPKMKNAYGGFGGGASIHGYCGGPAGGGGFTGGSTAFSVRNNGGGGGSYHIGFYHYKQSYSLAGFESMPNPTSSTPIIGNSGPGYAKISFLGDTPTRKIIFQENSAYRRIM